MNGECWNPCRNCWDESISNTWISAFSCFLTVCHVGRQLLDAISPAGDGFQLLLRAQNVLEALRSRFSMDSGTCLVPVPSTSSGPLTWSLTPGHCNPGMFSRLLSSLEGFRGGKHGCKVFIPDFSSLNPWEKVKCIFWVRQGM